MMSAQPVWSSELPNAFEIVVRAIGIGDENHGHKQNGKQHGLLLQANAFPCNAIPTKKRPPFPKAAVSFPSFARITRRESIQH
jgi:hypothetical protein